MHRDKDRDRDLRQEAEEAELNLILNETFAATDYMDEQIGHLLATQHTNDHPLKHDQSWMRKSSVNSGTCSREGSDDVGAIREEFGSEGSGREIFGGEYSVEGGEQSHDAKSRESQEDSSSSSESESGQGEGEGQSSCEESIEHIPVPNTYSAYMQQEESFRKQQPLIEIKERYPHFMVSQPSYTLAKPHEERIFKYNNSLMEVNIEAIDVGYCRLADEFRVAIGTDDGRVAIFEHTYTKPVNIFEAFPSIPPSETNHTKTMTIKYSKNQQYLFVSSDTKHAKVYEIKQSISIQEKSLLRMRKQPIQLFKLTPKQLKSPIVSIQFVSESPFMALIVDEEDEMYVLEYKKHILNYRPYLSQLPLKFNKVFRVVVCEVEGGCLMAVGSDQYVTICMLQPMFEVMMVYDKDKHGRGVPKSGYAHLAFREEKGKSVGLLIVWDKFAHILNIEIESVSPLRHKIFSEGMQLLPESTLLAGFLSNTLIFHISHSGLKIYPTTNFSTNSSSLTDFSPSIYHHPINFFQLPSGHRLQDQLILSSTPCLETLRLLSGLIVAEKGWVFLSSNTSLFSVRIEKFQRYIRNVVECYNNWKVGLQMLNDGYLGNFRDFDGMTEKGIADLLKQFSLKYIDFLKVVITDGNDELWAQEITFTYNILIETNQTNFLLEHLLPALLTTPALASLIVHLSPFILLHRVRKISPKSFRIMVENIEDRKVMSCLLANLDAEENEPDLPHSINRMLVNEGMLLEMIGVNFGFKDYYTPFVVLVGCFMERKNQNGDVEKIVQLLSYCCYKVIALINTPSSSSSNQQQQQLTSKSKQIQSWKTSKHFLQTFLPLLQNTLLPLLLESPSAESCLFSWLLPNLYNAQCLMLINQISNKLLSSDLMTDLIMSIPLEKVRDQTGYWICMIRLYNRGVVKIDVFMGIRELVAATIDQHQERDRDMDMDMEDHEIVKREKRKKNRIEGKSQQQQQQRQIHKLLSETVKVSSLKLQTQFQKISKQTLDTFFTSTLKTNHIPLVELTGRTLSCRFIETTHSIISSPKYRKHFLYPFLKKTIKKMSNSELQKLRNIIIENLEMFIALDDRELCDLVVDNYLHCLEKFVLGRGHGVDEVNSYVMVRFVERVLKRIAEEGRAERDMSQDQVRIFDSCGEFMLALRVRYLELLALTGRQHEILGEIRQENYPLDESLKICQKFGIMDAEAYLLVKSGGEGQVSCAIELYFKLITKQTLTLTPNNLPVFTEYLQSIIGQCMKICENLHNSPTHFTQQWFLITKNLSLMKKSIYSEISAYTCDILCDFIQRQIYPAIAEKIVRRNVLGSIVEALKVEIGEGAMDVKFVRVLLAEMVRSYSYQKVVFMLTQETFIDGELQSRKKIMRNALAGLKSKNMCELCEESKGLMIHYNNCGHQIHPSCGHDVKNCYICSRDNEMLIGKQLDIMGRIKTEIYAAEHDLIMGSESQQRIKGYLQRMKSFEVSWEDGLEYLL